MKRLLTMVLMAFAMGTLMFAQSIVGTWKIDPKVDINITAKSGEETKPISDLKNNMTMTFNEDKTAMLDLQLSVATKIGDANMVLKVKINIPGTYTINSDSTMTLQSTEGTDLDFDLDFPDLDKEQTEAIKSIALAQLRDNKDAMLAQFMENEDVKELMGTMKYKLEGDTLTFKDDLVMYRVKDTKANKNSK